MSFSPINIDTLNSDKVVLCVFLVDDSCSIGEFKNVGNVVNGYNSAIEVLMDADGGRGKYFGTTVLFNGGVVRNTGVIDKSMKLGGDFQVGGGTPLYRRNFEALKFLDGEAQRLGKAGVPCRTALVGLTDGEDYDENSVGVQKVASIARIMASNPIHQIFAVGVLNDRLTMKYRSLIEPPRAESNGFSALEGGLWNSFCILGKSLLQKVFQKVQYNTNFQSSSSQAPVEEATKFPTAYHVIFHEMGFTGPQVQILTAESTSQSIAAAMMAASQSIARTGQSARQSTTSFD